MFGVGGAIISTPAIRLLGASPIAAVASTLPSILPSGISGTHRLPAGGSRPDPGRGLGGRCGRVRGGGRVVRHRRRPRARPRAHDRDRRARRVQRLPPQPVARPRARDHQHAGGERARRELRTRRARRPPPETGRVVATRRDRHRRGRAQRAPRRRWRTHHGPRVRELGPPVAEGGARHVARVRGDPRDPRARSRTRCSATSTGCTRCRCASASSRERRSARTSRCGPATGRCASSSAPSSASIAVVVRDLARSSRSRDAQLVAARASTSSSIGSVRRPVNVFCWLGW